MRIKKAGSGSLLSCEWAVVTWSEPGCFPTVKVQRRDWKVAVFDFSNCCMENIAQQLWMLHLTGPEAEVML